MTPWTEPITDASAWTPDDLKKDQSWQYTLTDLQRSDLEKALEQVDKRGLQFGEITQEDFPPARFAENPPGYSG